MSSKCLIRKKRVLNSLNIPQNMIFNLARLRYHAVVSKQKRYIYVLGNASGQFGKKSFKL